MSAAEALKSARAAGVSVTIDSDDLVLRASVPPPPAVLDGLSRHKGRNHRTAAAGDRTMVG